MYIIIYCHCNKKLSTLLNVKKYFSNIKYYQDVVAPEINSTDCVSIQQPFARHHGNGPSILEGASLHSNEGHNGVRI